MKSFKLLASVLGLSLAAVAACDSSDDSSSTSSGAGGSAGCPTGQATCDGTCVDSRFDPKNCGACGNACADGEVCSEGVCGIACAGGATACEVDGKKRCVDTQVDSANCGACGTACSADQVCDKGACADDCNGGTTKCEVDGKPACFNLQNDPQHCGACDKACSGDESCIDGTCTVKCVAGTTVCMVPKPGTTGAGGGGGAGGAMTSGAGGAGGVMTSGAGGAGGAGGAMTSGAGGAGGSMGPEMMPVCVDTNLDPQHCGGCGNACAPGEVCSQGKCGLECVGGSTKCDDTCRNLGSDPSNCGSCGTVCGAPNASNFCDAGVCGFQCKPGFGDCDASGANGCEGKLLEDEANCGACGKVCGVGQACTNGSCFGPFVIWGDYVKDGTSEIGRLTFPDGTVAPIALPNVTLLQATYAVVPSPDRTKLAYAIRADNVAPKIYIGNADLSGTPIVVADLTGAANAAASIELSSLTWSPNGARLAFLADAAINGQSMPFVVPTDGTGKSPKVLATTGASTQEVSAGMAWANATVLFFAGDITTNDAPNLYFVDASAVAPSPTAVFAQNTLTTATTGKNVKGGIQRGADGKIYFRSSHVVAGKNLVYSCEANGTGVTALPGSLVASVGGQADVTAFQLSPDGKSVALTANEKNDGLSQVYALKLVDSVATKLTNFAKPGGATTSGLLSSLTGLEWSPDGAYLTAVGDWAALDNEFALYGITVSAAPKVVRLLNVPVSSDNRDVEQAWFSTDGKRLVVRADLIVNNNTELYALSDFAAADQSPTAVRVVEVPTNGDVDGAVAP